MSKFSLSCRRLVAGGVAIAPVLAVGAVSTLVSVSTAVAVVAPNGGSASGLANTGARVNPVALAQLGLFALLVGGGLPIATRRRAGKH